MEYDLKCTLIKIILCWYFYKDFRPSFKLWIDEKYQKLDSWDILIGKANKTRPKPEYSPSPIIILTNTVAKASD